MTIFERIGNYINRLRGGAAKDIEKLWKNDIEPETKVFLASFLTYFKGEAGKVLASVVTTAKADFVAGNSFQTILNDVGAKAAQGGIAVSKDALVAGLSAVEADINAAK